MDINELKNNIFQLHFKYLETDKIPEQLELRKNLEFLIRKYLCAVPHREKFHYHETYKILEKSLSRITKEDNIKPAFGFESIAIYACNLYMHPWRKEYKTIRIYSGYYQHEVSHNLVDAELLLQQMGYVKKDNNKLYLEGDLCPEQIRNVSRDAIAASVECQIIREIYLSLDQKFTLENIYRLRENFIGNENETLEHVLTILNQQSIQPHHYVNVNYNNQQQITSYNHHPSSSCMQHASQYPPVQMTYGTNKIVNGNREFDVNYSLDQTDAILANQMNQMTIYNQNNFHNYNVSGTRAPYPPNLNYFPEHMIMNQPVMPPNCVYMPHQNNYQAPMMPVGDVQTGWIMNNHNAYYPGNYQHLLPIQNSQRCLETHFPARNDPVLIPEPKPIVTNKHSRSTYNYSTPYHVSGYAGGSSINSKYSQDYDNITDDKTSSRNSDFDSYEERELHKKTLSKMEDGVGSYEKWGKIYRVSLENKEDENDKTMEALNLDQANPEKKIKTKLLVSNDNDYNKTKQTKLIPDTKLNSSKSPTLKQNGTTSYIKTNGDLKQQTSFKKTIKEWNCSMCTYFNTDNVRVCAICNHPKDLYPESQLKKQACVK